MIKKTTGRAGDNVIPFGRKYEAVEVEPEGNGHALGLRFEPGNGEWDVFPYTEIRLIEFDPATGRMVFDCTMATVVVEGRNLDILEEMLGWDILRVMRAWEPGYLKPKAEEICIESITVVEGFQWELFSGIQ